MLFANGRFRRYRGLCACVCMGVIVYVDARAYVTRLPSAFNFDVKSESSRENINSTEKTFLFLPGERSSRRSERKPDLSTG